MDGIIAMVQTLIDKGFAYEDHGTVYYDTKKFPEYGKLSRKNLDELIAGASERVTIDDAKKNPTDFVLWKPKKRANPAGHPLGARADPVGISNAPLCPSIIWGIPLISTQAARI